MITKLLGPLEIGKVFSVLAAFQAMMPLLASPTYGFIYKRTVATFPGKATFVYICFLVFFINFHPGVFLLFSAGLYLLMVSLLFLANLKMRNSAAAATVDPEPEQMQKFLEKQMVSIKDKVL